MLYVSCQCGLQFQAAEHLAGEQVSCPNCNRLLTVPGSPQPGAQTPPQLSKPSLASKSSAVPLLIGGGVAVLAVGLIVLVVVLSTANSNSTPDLATQITETPVSRPKTDPAKAPTTTPGKASTSGPQSTDGVDLLALKTDAKLTRGNWTISDGSLMSSAGTKAAYVYFPYELPANYRIDAEVEVFEGEGSFNLVVVVDGHPVMVALDGWGSYKSGLSLLNGRSGDRNITTRSGRLLTPGRPHQVSVVVHQRGEVEVSVDQKSIIQWSGEPRELTLDARFWPDMGNRPAVSCWLTRFKVSRLHLTPL